MKKNYTQSIHKKILPITPVLHTYLIKLTTGCGLFELWSAILAS